MKSRSSALTFIIVSLLLCKNSYGQLYKMMMEDPKYNIYEVKAEAERYFATNPKGKGSGYGPYQRWLSKNEPLFFPSGDRSRFDSKDIVKAYESIKRQSLADRSTSAIWQDKGPYNIDSITGHYAPGLGRVECVWVDKNNTNKLYLSSRSGGFWRSTNGGATWQNTTDVLNVTGVNTFDVNPLNSNDILINTQGALNNTSHGIYRSLDGGLTWNPTVFMPSNTGLGGFGSDFKVAEIKFHPLRNDTIYVTCTDGLYRSTNNFATISKMRSGGLGEMEFHPTDPNTMYICFDYYWDRNKLLKSTNGGTTFTQIQDFTVNNYSYPAISTTKANPNVLYFSSSTAIWKSTDQGATFTQYATKGGSFGVSDLQENQCISGGIDAWRTNDVTNANGWIQSSDWYLPPPTSSFPSDYVHADLRYVLAVNGVFYLGTDGFMTKSVDGGINWTILSNNVGIRENYCLGISQSNNDVASFGSQDNGSTYLGKNGQWVEWYGADGMEQIVHPANPDYVIGNLQNGGKRKSKNATLTNENVPNPSGVTFDWIAPLAYNPLNFNTVYSVGNSLCRSRDFGTTFTTLYAFPGNVHEFAIAENNSAIMLASINSTLYKSVNGGVTFTAIGTGVLPNHFIRDIEFDPKDDNTFIVVYNQYNNNNARVYITRNGGSTWQNISYNLSAIPAYSVVIDHSPQKNIYIGTETGVFVKSMAGTTYSVFGTGLPPIGVYELEINYGANALKLASWGRGHWETHLKDRANFPEIEEVSFSSNIAEGVTVGQQFYVFAKVENINTVNKMYIKHSTNNIGLNQTMDMMRMNDSMFISVNQMQSNLVSDSTYFKVYAVSPSNDTTETYRFMYKSINKPPYCAAAGSSGTGADWINRVKVGTDEKTSAQSTYSDFTSTVFNIPQFQSKQIFVRLNVAFSQDKAFAWVDWNQSGVFDNNEAITLSAYNGSYEASGIIAVPQNVVDGDYRLRIRNAYNAPNAIACGNYSGEVEDYTIRVSSACNANPMVMNLNNAYIGSLRLELENACPNDTIKIDAALLGDTLRLYNTIMVNKEISILGHSSNNFTFSGENKINIFQNIRPLVLENLNLINAFSLAPNGGAIVNYSDLTLKKVLFDNNKEGVTDKALTNYGNVSVVSGLTTIKQ